MKAFRLGLLGLVLSAGLVTTAYAHDPNISWSIQFGYPGYVEPPAIYYPLAPLVYYVPPPVYYAPRIERRVVVVPQHDYPDFTTMAFTVDGTSTVAITRMMTTEQAGDGHALRAWRTQAIHPCAASRSRPPTRLSGGGDNSPDVTAKSESNCSQVSWLETALRT